MPQNGLIVISTKTMNHFPEENIIFESREKFMDYLRLFSLLLPQMAKMIE